MTIPATPTANTATHDRSDDDPSNDSGTPLEYLPFLLPPVGRSIKPFKDFQTRGVYIRSESTLHGLQRDLSLGEGTSYGPSHDAHGTPLLFIDRPVLGVDVSFKEQEETRRAGQREANRRRRAAAGNSALRVSKEDCWKIGQPDSGWEEPAETTLSDFDVSIPPFTRLLSATRDFLYTRHEEFQFDRNKRLFILLRNALGLKAEFSAHHWPGHGPDGARYVPPSAVRRHQTADWGGSSEDGEEAPSRGASAEYDPLDEACALLRVPEISIRGFLALARREAEAGWHFEPAFKLTVITAAFMSFLTHHKVLSEPALSAAFERAAYIARSAPQQLIEAKQLEDAIGFGSGWNRGCWTIWGGNYGGPERGGLEKEENQWGSSSNVVDEQAEKDADENGWTVDPVIDDRPEALTKEQALPHILPLLEPLSKEATRLVHYIPYARRRVTSVLPPLQAGPGVPVYATRSYRLITVPAPWSPEEKWRAHKPRFDDEVSDEDANDDADEEAPLDLDQERASIEEPAELTVWVEKQAVPDAIVPKLVGMGLRGRWGLMGRSGEDDQSDYSQWWTFKAKDCG
ncbi:hypothetical protein I317_01812 [Kwoniella heveanensis CBS 569]|nr:hypothetical protein I317_01812 [Kwoniella heveanensis CBS 569]